MTDQLLPQAPDAEKALVSCFFEDPRKIGSLCASKQIGRTHFASPGNAEIYAMLMRMWREDDPIDLVTVSQALRDASLLDEAGGIAYVADVRSFSTSSVSNAEQYAEILHEKFLLRSVIGVCHEFSSRSFTDQDQAGSMLAEIQDRIATLGSTGGQPVSDMKANVAKTVQEIDDLYRKKGAPGISTGLNAIDTELCLEPGDLLVIGGQTKAGKSILASQIALNMVLSGIPVLYISLEMTETQVTRRMLASLARLNMRMVNMFSEADFGRLSAASARLALSPLHIVCRRNTLQEIVAVSQQYHARYEHTDSPLGAIVLDYAQITQGMRNAKTELRQQEIAEISRTSKRMAQKLNCLWVLLSQLNEDGRTREAKDIENDCNAMVEVGHNKDTGERGIKVVLARSAASGQRLKLRIIAEHTRVEDGEDIPEPEDGPHPYANKNRR